MQRLNNSYKQLLVLLALFLSTGHISFSQVGMIIGKLTTEKGHPISEVAVEVDNTELKTQTDLNGNYILMNVPYGKYNIHYTSEKYFRESQTVDVQSEQTTVNKTLTTPVKNFDLVEVFGSKNKQPDKLDAITRLPLLPTEQIQSISIISDKVIEQQGNLSIAEASRNVPGVYTYATYGGVRESMSSRGFRGIPVLKNGVRIHTDFRGTGFATDFSGVESVQILKGANSIAMGAATDLGSPGGIINVVTKTPHFVNRGQVSMRIGSFNQFRPTFDVQNVIGKEGKFAFRINGAYETVRTFQNIKGLGQQKFYVNPSLAWRPDEKTEIVLEMDYLNDVRAFDPGTVNLSTDNSENLIYNMPQDRFLGFKGNNAIQKTATYALRVKRDLAKNLYIRAAAYFADYNGDGITSSLKALNKVDSLDINVTQNNLYKRSIGRSGERKDRNMVVQLDLVGHKIKTGIVSHTFQAGIDFRTTKTTQTTYGSILVDTIDVFSNVSNELRDGLPDFVLASETTSNTNSLGVSAQEVLDIAGWVQLFGGVRFSTSNSYSPVSNKIINDNFINPVGGIMVKIWKGLNVFGSYTNSTNPRTAEYVDINGKPLGNETISQYEAGIKSSWFNHRLRFNTTFYFIQNKGMNIKAAVENPVTGLVELQNYYFKGGNDERKGIEVELAGRIIRNLEVMIGYSFINSRYREHTTFVQNSSPNNTPSHTLNAYVSYNFEKTAVRGLSLGVGYYYLGARPYNDWTQSNVQYHGITPNLKPWNNKAYSLLNAQIGYDFKYLSTKVLRNFDVRLIANNLTNTIGYDAYRTSFINRINPRNFAFVVTYRF